MTRSSEEGGEDGPSCPETRTYRSAALSPSGTSPGTRGGGWLRTPAPSPGGPGASLHSSGLQPHILLPVTPKYSLHSESLMDTRLPRRGERERSFSPWILRARLGPHPLAGQKALRTLGRCRMPASCVHLWAASASFPAFLSFSQTRVTKTSRQGWFPQQKPQRRVGRKLPGPGGLRRGTARPAAPLRRPQHEGPSGTCLDRQQPGRAPTSTPTGPPWSAGCCQQSPHRAVVRLLPASQAPSLALRC